MTTFKYINRLERIFNTIKFGRTGNSEAFAKKMGVSRRQLFYHLEELKDMGIPIRYDRNTCSFRLDKDCIFKVSLQVKIIEENEMDKYEGGVNIFYQRRFLFMNFPPIYRR